MLTEVHAPDDLEAATMVFAETLGSGPSVAIRMSKALTDGAATRSLADQLAEEKTAGGICAKTEDAKEAMAAVIAKREPVFKGYRPHDQQEPVPCSSPTLLKGKKILITGGGLGKAMDRRYCELGAEPVVCGRRKEVLDETAEISRSVLGAKVTTHSLDIRDADAVAAMVDTIWQEGPVNNAAGNFIPKAENLSHRAVDAVLNIVLHGTCCVTLACGKK